jgi:hypothetical protein
MVRVCLLALALLVLPFPLFGQSPSDFDRVFVRALEMQKAGDFIGAIDAYKTALAIDSTRVDALSNLGAAYVTLDSSRTRSRNTTPRSNSIRRTPRSG